jgi:hypothetical protein
VIVLATLAVTVVLALLTAVQLRSWGYQDASGLSADQQKAIARAAQQYAQAIAGNDETSPAYNRLFQHAIEGAMKFVPRGRMASTQGAQAPVTPEDRVVSPFARARAGVQDRLTERRSIFTDPTWLRNEAKRRQRALQEEPGRIFGGRPANPGELPDCVAVQGASCLCTGTLIGPNVVVTAGHCDEGGCVDRIFIGNNTNQQGRTINVKKSIRHPDFDSNTLANDLTVLILEEKVQNVTPRPIATSAEIDSASSLQLAGFGLTESNGLGRKFVVEVAIASNSCQASVAGGFGCHQDKEIVAGGNGHDSCNGDSGGPAYVMTASGLKLAGATSRAVANSVANCGDGGIYVRVDRYLDFIRTTAQNNGGELP